MNREEFLQALKVKLRFCDKETQDSAIEYYQELILDKMNGGMSESEVIASFDIEAIVNELRSECLENHKQPNIHKTVLIAIALCFGAGLLPLAVVVIVLYFLIYVIWGCLLIATSCVSLATFAYGIYCLFNNSGFAMATFNLGMGLVIGALSGLITYGIYKLGLKVILGLNDFIKNKVFKKAKERGNKNESN